MPVAAVRYASPASIPADLPRYAALCYPTGSVVPGDVKRLECGLYLPSESVPGDRRKVGVVQYPPGAVIPTDMRRIIPVRSGSVAYANAVLADSPVAYWRLGESSGTSAADTSGNGNTGTYTGGVTLGVPGALAAEPDGTSNTAALFASASTQYVALPNAQIIGGANYANDFTAAAWVAPTATGKVVFSQGNSAAANSLFELIAGTSGLTFNLRNDAGTLVQLMDNAPLPSGVYSHVAFTRSGTTWRMFANGVQTATNTNFSPSGVYTVDRATIGVRAGSGLGSGTAWDGRLDEVAVYATALSAARIAAHYAAGTGR